MKNGILKLLGLSLVLITLSACGGGGGGSDDSSGTQKALSSSSNAQDPKEEVLPEEDILDVEIDLDKPLSDGSAATSVSSASMKGISPYSTKSMWGSASVSHYSTNTRHFYVAPQCLGTEAIGEVCGETTNKGTKESPWDFYGTIKGEHPISSDSVVWMLAGEYSHPDNTATENVPFQILISGETDKPIHFRAENGDFNTVKINAGVNIAGDWIWLWDVEMTYIRQDGEAFMYDELTGDIINDWRPGTVSPPHYTNTSGYGALHDNFVVRLEPNVTEVVDNSKFINVRSHKLGEGVGVWSRAANFEVYGSILYDNGWSDLERGHGHGLYLQNNTGTKRTISDNIIAGNLGHGLQIYSSQVSATENFDIIGNVFFAARETNGNSLLMGFNGSKNMIFNENYISAYALKMPYGLSADELYEADGFTKKYVSPDYRQCKNNVFYAAYMSEDYDCDKEPSNKIYSYYNSYAPPASHLSYIRPNKYDGRRANLVVINPNKEDIVSIDLGTFAKPGDKVMIFNALEMNVPIEYGTYNGTYVNIHWPETTWALQRYVSTPDDEIKKEFWAFVVINLGQ